MVSEPLAAVLRSGRAEFNRQFAEARRVHPNLDGAGFAEFLRGVVDPFIREIARVRSDAVTDAVMVAYEIALELAGQKLVGTGARSPLIEQGWQRVLVAVAGLAAASPARVLGAVSNALHNLASIPGARGEEWIEALERLGPKCPDVDALLRLGQVLAWKAGLAHFRAGAIAAADALPTSIALAALGAPQETSWPELRERLLGDPWFDPAKPKAETCQVTFIGYLLESFELEDINAAIRASWEMLSKSSTASLKFHKETKLLIAKGDDEELKLAAEVLKSLQQAAAVKKQAELHK